MSNNFTYIDGEFRVQAQHCPKKAAANHAAYKVWEDARKTAASYQDIEQWQRLNRATNALHPTLNIIILGDRTNA